MAADHLSVSDALFVEHPRLDQHETQAQTAGIRRLHHGADLGLLTELALKHERQALGGRAAQYPRRSL